MKTIFIAGPRAIKKLDEDVLFKLDDMKEKGHTIYVGDANGVDKLIQGYYKNLKYSNVEVFSSNGKVRNNLGDWKVNNIIVDKSIKGFDFYVEKDKAMANKSEYGFMIWNSKSKGTLNNMINLRNQNKDFLLYLTIFKTFHYIDSNEKLLNIINNCNEDVKKTYFQLQDKINPKPEQISIEI